MKKKLWSIYTANKYSQALLFPLTKVLKDIILRKDR